MSIPAREWSSSEGHPTSESRRCPSRWQPGWGGNVLSTDSLARHPGRPWKPAPEKVPDHVAEHYLSLSVDELLEDVLRHYRVIVWPKAEEIVASHSHDTSGAGVVLEGSALWPEFVTDLSLDRVAALWLTASDDVLRRRIHAGSMYDSKSPRERLMVGSSCNAQSPITR